MSTPLTLPQLRSSAFAKWLLMQDRSVALQYLFDALRDGDQGHLAWELWVAVHGDKKFGAAEVGHAIEQMLDAVLAEGA